MNKLIEFSRRYGADNELVIAGGGNTSMKDSGILYVKRSGAVLATATEDSFVGLDMKTLLAVTEKTYPDDDSVREAEYLKDVMAARLPSETDKRPSVEALLHALFPQKYVLHLHPTLVNALTCANDGKRWAEKMMGNNKMLWIPACKPGYTLAKLLCDKLSENVRSVLLQNHGVFFASDDAEELAVLLKNMLNKIKQQLSVHPDLNKSGGLPKFLESHSGCLRFNNSVTARMFAASEGAAESVMRPFTPDQIVYCGAKPEYINDPDQLHLLPETGIAITKNHGICAMGKTDKDAENAMLVFEDAMKISIYAQNFGGPRPLDPELVAFIVNWEAESYRKSQVK